MEDTTIDMFSDLLEATNEPVIFKGDKWDRLPDILANDPDLNFYEDGSSMAIRVIAAINAIKEMLLAGYTASLGYSAGKDSEASLHLLLFAMVSLVRAGKRNQISPYSYVGHTDTGIENPEIRYLADKKLAALQRFIDEEDLPLTIAIERPGLSSSWPGRILTGRGLPTFVNSNARQCSNELKVGPAKRLAAKMKQRMPKEMRNKICLLLGSRDAESTIRANNIAKRGGNDVKFTVLRDGNAELYPVKSWSVDNIWDFLLACGSAESPMLPLPSYQPDNKETAELYRAATGECIWGASSPKKSEACGARFGCAFCTAAGSDDSMEEMLYEVVDGDQVVVERYAYMHGLNRVQRYLIKTQWDWSQRHPIGRTIYSGGYIRLQPDVYRPGFLRRLLHVCCSLDYQEQQRAVETKVRLLSGDIEDNAHNRRMCNPQFRIITPAALIHIAFLWSFHHFVETPFEAIRIYRKVWEFGDLDLLEDEPSLMAVPRSTIDNEWWIKVPRWGDGSLADGLADPISAMTYFDGQDDERAARKVNTWDGPRHVVSFVDSNETSIDEEAADWVIWEDYPRLWEQVQDGLMTNTDAARYFMRMGVVSMAKGMTGKYHQMMQRGQTLTHLGLSGDISMLDVLMKSDVHVIGTKTYHAELKRKFQREQRKINRLLSLKLVIDTNLHQRTPLGVELEQQLRKEENAKRMAKLKGIANTAETFGMSILALRAQWMVAQPNEKRYGQDHLRKWRKAIVEISQSLTRRDWDSSKITEQLTAVLDDVETRILDPKADRAYSEHTMDAIEQAPASMLRCVDVWRKQIRMLNRLPKQKSAAHLRLVANNKRGDSHNQLALAI